MSAEIQTRWDFPIPSKQHRTVMQEILGLMLDGKRRSKAEIREALGLGPDVEITARLRDLRKPENGAWSIPDARAEGPDSDGVFRYQLKPPKVTR